MTTVKAENSVTNSDLAVKNSAKREVAVVDQENIKALAKDPKENLGKLHQPQKEFRNKESNNKKEKKSFFAKIGSFFTSIIDKIKSVFGAGKIPEHQDLSFEDPKLIEKIVKTGEKRAKDLGQSKDKFITLWGESHLPLDGKDKPKDFLVKNFRKFKEAGFQHFVVEQSGEHLEALEKGLLEHGFMEDSNIPRKKIKEQIVTALKDTGIKAAEDYFNKLYARGLFVITRMQAGLDVNQDYDEQLVVKQTKELISQDSILGPCPPAGVKVIELIQAAQKSGLDIAFAEDEASSKSYEVTLAMMIALEEKINNPKNEKMMDELSKVYAVVSKLHQDIVSNRDTYPAKVLQKLAEKGKGKVLYHCGAGHATKTSKRFQNTVKERLDKLKIPNSNICVIPKEQFTNIPELKNSGINSKDFDIHIS